MGCSLSLIIPAYNETDRLEAGLQRLMEAAPPDGTEIIVVDDGSTDATADVARATLASWSSHSVISLPKNSGKGAAVRVGVAHARGDSIGYMDADMGTDPKDLKLLVDALRRSHVAVGSRAHELSVVQRDIHRRIMNRVFGMTVASMTRLPYMDTQCAFKAFRGPIAKLLWHGSRVDRFAFDVEVLDLAVRFGLQMEEVPVTWIDVSGSKVRPVHDGLQMFGDVAPLPPDPEGGPTGARRLPAGRPHRGRPDADSAVRAERRPGGRLEERNGRPAPGSAADDRAPNRAAPHPGSRGVPSGVAERGVQVAVCSLLGGEYPPEGAGRMNGFKHSVELFKAFRHEATDPETFYGLLADDTVADVSRFCQVYEATVLDVGGASGYVGDAFRAAGGSAVTAEYDFDQMTEHGRSLVHGVIADGCALPIATGSVDVSYSSNVLEHVISYRRMLAEMVRVVAPGGVIYITFTNWLSPWGGHETSPWHYFGGEWSARRFERKTGAPPRTGSVSASSDWMCVMSSRGARSAPTSRSSTRFPGTTHGGPSSWSTSRW